MGILSWITWVAPKCHHKGTYKREARRSKEEQGKMMMEAERKKRPCDAGP